MNQKLSLNDEFESRIIAPEQAIEHLNTLKALDLNAITDEELEALFHSLFHIMPYSSGKIAEGAMLYRCRVNEQKRPYEEVKEIFVPPASVITSHGRANKPNEQIFYAAFNSLLAINETVNGLKNVDALSYDSIKKYPDLQAGIAFLTVGEWRIKKPLHVATIIDSPKLHSLRKDILQSYEALQALLNNGTLKPETVSSQNLLSQFFADEFTKDPIKSSSDYKFSSMYTSSLRMANTYISEAHKNQRFDGINYPSVANRYEGDNVALFTESLLDKLEIVRAFQVVCTQIDFSTGQCQAYVLSESKKIENGVIHWDNSLQGSLPRLQ